MPIAQALITVDSKFKPEYTLDMVPEGQIIIAPSSSNDSYYFAWVKLNGRWYTHERADGTTALGPTSTQPSYADNWFDYDGWKELTPPNRSVPANPLRVLDKQVKIAES